MGLFAAALSLLQLRSRMEIQGLFSLMATPQHIETLYAQSQLGNQ
jgi:hypothetical protein